MTRSHRIIQRSALCLAISAMLPACQVQLGNDPLGTGGASEAPGQTTNLVPGDSTGAPVQTGTALPSGIESNSTGVASTVTSGRGSMPGSGSTGATTNSSTTSSSVQERGEPGTSTSTSTDTQSSTEGPDADPKDPYLWLEEIESKPALDWVKAQNQQTLPRLTNVTGYTETRDELLAILNSDDRIPGITKIGDLYYNFWRDATHPRGIWRRTTLESYETGKAEWTTVLDLDKLAEDEKENWVWGSANCMYPSGERCLISLSRGGGDTKVVREFDTASMSFVKDGFNLPAAKSYVSWQDKDHVYVGTNFGEGSLTNSGYPRTSRYWTRGTKVEDAKEILAGKATDILVYGMTSVSRGVKRNLVTVYTTFYDQETYRINANNTLRKYDTPSSASVGFWGPWMTIQLREDWKVGDKVYKQGSYLIIDEIAFLAGERNFDVLYQPDGKGSLEKVSGTKDYLLMAQTRDVKGLLVEWNFSSTSGKWEKREIKLPGSGGVNMGAMDRDRSNQFVMTYEDHITPMTYFLGTAGTDERKALRSMPATFDASNLEVVQHFATSKDGTKIPYFQVSRKGMNLDGKHPTLLYGYGGFENSQKPRYLSTVGKTWLENGGVYVVANIRGGGEYGPAWHRAALKEKRQNAFDDFIAVGEDLVRRKVTESGKLGIQGGSNGGLLTGAVMVQRPDLWGAVVSQVPLLDMKRYHKLLAGASWMGEYGNPDLPEEWAFLSKYSPYQNVKEGVNYPPLFLTTSTQDDRVHPAHARKMMAKMLSQGHSDLYYFENTEGGHGAAANNDQLAEQRALITAFLADKLGLTLK